jgi:hypothetical protein
VRLFEPSVTVPAVPPKTASLADEFVQVVLLDPFHQAFGALAFHVPVPPKVTPPETAGSHDSVAALPAGARHIPRHAPISPNTHLRARPPTDRQFRHRTDFDSPPMGHLLANNVKELRTPH